jgi:hypothetical protein
MNVTIARIEPGHEKPEPCHVLFDLPDRELRVEWGWESKPSDRYLTGAERRYPAPPLTGAQAAALLGDLLELAEAIDYGARVEWRGDDPVYELDAAALRAEEDVRRLCRLAGEAGAAG